MTHPAAQLSEAPTIAAELADELTTARDRLDLLRIATLGVNGWATGPRAPIDRGFLDVETTLATIATASDLIRAILVELVDAKPATASTMPDEVADDPDRGAALLRAHMAAMTAMHAIANQPRSHGAVDEIDELIDWHNRQAKPLVARLRASGEGASPWKGSARRSALLAWAADHDATFTCETEGALDKILNTMTEVGA